MRGLGDLTEKIISIITLGQGKKIATYIAKLRGKEDCGCNRRQNKLNKILSFNQKLKKMEVKTITLDWTEKWHEIRNQVPCSCQFDYMFLEILNNNSQLIEEIKIIDPPILNGQITSMHWGVDILKNPSYITIKCHKKEGGFTNEVKTDIKNEN